MTREMSTTRLRETEAVRERERILSTPLSRKPSDLSLVDRSSYDLSLLSPPGQVLVKQTPVHRYNLRPGLGYTPKWSSTPLTYCDSRSSTSSSDTLVKIISSSPAVLVSGQVEEVNGILDFQKRLDVIDGQEEVDSGKTLNFMKNFGLKRCV